MNSNYLEHFDLDPSIIYLNSGSVSIAPRRVTEAKIKFYRDCELNPTLTLWNAWSKLWEVQNILANFLGVSPTDLIIRRNVTEAMNAFLLGFDDLGPKGGEILVNDHEYGAIINICRVRAERSGLKLRSFPLLENYPLPNTDQIVDSIKRELRPETRLMVLSHVLTTNGFVLPIREIAKETRKRGILLAIDGAHATGAVEINFNDLDDIDFYGGNLHKWVMGPKGVGFGWIPKRHHDRVHALEGSWTNYESNYPHDAFGEGSRMQGRLLMSATQDFSSFFTIPEAISFWKEIGPPQILAYRKYLRGLLIEEVQKNLGWKFLSSAQASQGPLLAWELPDKLQKLGGSLMWEILKKKGIQIAINKINGKYCMRLSPGLQNTEIEMQKSIRAIKELYHYS